MAIGVRAQDLTRRCNQRNADFETRTLVGLGMQADGMIQQPRKAFDDEKAQPQSTLAALAGRRRPKELAEYLGLQFRRDARPGRR